MNVAGAWATFFAPFHLARFSFVPVVSVRLFLSSSERKRKMEEKVESVMMKTQLCSFFARDICYLVGSA